MVGCGYLLFPGLINKDFCAVGQGIVWQGAVMFGLVR